MAVKAMLLVALTVGLAAVATAHEVEEVGVSIEATSLQVEELHDGRQLLAPTAGNSSTTSASQWLTAAACCPSSSHQLVAGQCYPPCPAGYQALSTSICITRCPANTTELSHSLCLSQAEGSLLERNTTNRADPVPAKTSCKAGSPGGCLAFQERDAMVRLCPAKYALLGGTMCVEATCPDCKGQCGYSTVDDPTDSTKCLMFSVRSTIKRTVRPRPCPKTFTATATGCLSPCPANYTTDKNPTDTLCYRNCPQGFTGLVNGTNSRCVKQQPKPPLRQYPLACPKTHPREDGETGGLNAMCLAPCPSGWSQGEYGCTKRCPSAFPVQCGEMPEYQTTDDLAAGSLFCLRQGMKCEDVSVAAARTLAYCQ